MMGGLSKYFLEKVQSKTGLSTPVIVGYALQGLFRYRRCHSLFHSPLFCFL